MNDLAGMAAHVAKRVQRLKVQEPVEALRARPLYARAPLDPAPMFAPDARVAEVRFADPTSGLLVPRAEATAEEAARRAVSAAAAGAVAVGVWVERNFHAGDYAHLEAVRAACPGLLLVSRDLVLDPWQIERARAAGADAVELLPDLLGESARAVAEEVRARGLAPVVWGPGPRVRPFG